MKKILLALALLAGAFAPTLTAATDYYRLSWREDPSTTMVVGWRQNGGTGTTVHYGPTDLGTNYAGYPSSATTARTTTAKGMTHGFARLTGLTPDTAYYFVVRDSSGTSARMWFRTAPASAKDFAFIAGGDSRNNRTPRQNANRLVSKLRPLFVMFGGDYTDGNTNTEWSEWFADWQLTISSDGRIYPIVATRGNHDDNLSLVDMFDIPSANVYYALPIGGSYMRLYTLNSEITPGSTQASWLLSDLQAHTAVKWKIGQYHKPMYPHEPGKAENVAQYSAWAQPFYDHAMSLVIDSDSHVVKHTWPIKPTGNTAVASAYVRDDARGTVFVGEGCWGAPLRTASDTKAYTRDAGSFNSFHWVHARSDRMELRTINVDNAASVGTVSDSAPFTSPSGLNVWTPANGAVITMYPRSTTPPANVAPTVSLTAPAPGATATAPATFTISANAADSDGTVSSVAFYAGSTLIGTDTTSPYSLSWSNVAAGSYSVTARATDNAGATTTSAAVSVTVNPAVPGNVAPTVSLTAPAPGATATAPATFTVSANAADSDGTVSSVAFYAGATLIGTDTTSPYSLSWANIAAGSYSVTARATDNAGATTTSAAVSVTVNPAAGTSVTVSFQQGVAGYAGATDTKIRSDATTTNYGTNTVLEIDGSPDYAALLRFDLSSIPAGKTITAVSLTVNVTDASASAYEIYALRRSWTESSATWVRASSTANWSTAGANSTSTDRESTVLGTVTGTVGSKTFAFNSAGVAKVQSWVNTPSGNYGFVIQDYVNNTDGIDLSSKENTTAANRPKLTVTYQ